MSDGIGESRRSFLGGAALLAGGLALGAGRAYGQDGGELAIEPLGPGKTPNPPGDGEPIGVAVLGTGGMGRGHISAFMAMRGRGEANINIVALCDVNDLHAAEAKKIVMEGGQETEPEIYRDYKEALKRPDVHGVLIAAPEHWHARMSMDAIVAGKDVFCEKPMTLRLPEAIALRKTLHANPGVIFIVGTQKIMLPKYIEAKKLIDEGGIGVPTFSQTSYCRNSPEGEWNYYQIDESWEPGKNLDWDRWLGGMGSREWDPKVYIRWRRYRDFSTGIIGDLLVHEITPMVMALESCGWPVRVSAMGSHLIDKEMENHDQVNLAVKFESGHQMIVAGSTCNEVGLENLIRGHEANIYLNGRHCEVRPTRPYVDFQDARRIDCPDIGNDQDALRLDWFGAIRSRKQPPSTVDLGTKVMVIVDLATRSLWDQKAYVFDPETMKGSPA